MALSASSSFCGLICSPQPSSTTTGTPPQRSTFSIMRPPNTPLRHTITLSPGATRFTKQYSMPTDPGPDIGNVSAFLVWKTYRNSDLSSSIMSTKTGSRYPIAGRLIAAMTRGLISEGPGPSNVRCGGWNEAMRLAGAKLFSLQSALNGGQKLIINQRLYRLPRTQHRLQRWRQSRTTGDPASATDARFAGF